MGEEMESPLENVFASTFLGSEKFMDWTKEEWVGFKNTDEGNIPVEVISFLNAINILYGNLGIFHYCV